MLCLFTACKHDSDEAVALLVTVLADDQVAGRLQRIDADVYAIGKSSASHHRFDIVDSASSRTVLRFGIQRGTSARVRVVVRGYDSRAVDAKPFIEHKAIASLLVAQRMSFNMYLADACLDTAQRCSQLERTCAAVSSKGVRAGDCMTVLDADGGDDAGLTTAASCGDADACVPLDEGRFAQWPMPDSHPDSLLAPAYDVDAEQNEVFDERTGLIWQRTLPTTYPGCSVTGDHYGDRCRFDEAKDYCAQLGPDRWRLPRKIELESLLEDAQLRLGTAAVDAAAFPGTSTEVNYWSASSVAGSNASQAWAVDFSLVGTTATKVAAGAAVRCVRTKPDNAGLPDKPHYEADLDHDRIIDNWTRLAWQSSPGEPYTDVAQASAACHARGEGWRLPWIKELMTLVDPERSKPALDPVLQSPVRNTVYVSGSGLAATGGSLVLVVDDGEVTSEGSLKNAEQTTNRSGYYTFATRCVSVLKD